MRNRSTTLKKSFASLKRSRSLRSVRYAHIFCGVISQKFFFFAHYSIKPCR